MGTSIDLKELWGQEEINTPDVVDFIKKTQKFKKRNTLRLAFTVLILMLTIIWIISVWIFFKPEWITTKIGNILVITTIATYIVFTSKMLPLFTRPGFEMNVSQYLDQLLHIKRKEIFLGKKLIHFYFSFLSLGLFLYSLEYISQASIIFKATAMGILIVWIGINWLYFLPKCNRKRFKKLDILIDKFHQIKEQIEKD